MIMDYEFHINLSEGIEPSEILDLQSVINKFADYQSFENEFIYGSYSTDTTRHIELNISKYFDKYYKIEPNISAVDLYSFIHQIVYKMYENKVINKYVLYVKDSEFIPELWYPIGNMDLPTSSNIYYKIYTMNWIVYPLMIQISLRKDYEILDTLLGNMNPKYFEKMKDAYYDEIMNLSDNRGSVVYGMFNMDFDEDFRIRFIHWCNYYASMNEDEDNDIML